LLLTPIYALLIWVFCRIIWAAAAKAKSWLRGDEIPLITNQNPIVFIQKNCTSRAENPLFFGSV
jgi:hypothetical protein